MEEDLKGITTPNHNPPVLSPIVQRRDQGYSRLARVLVDIGSSVDILYWVAVLNLRLQEEDLPSGITSVKGFSQVEIRVAGVVTLPIMLGDHAKETTINVTFTVVRMTSSYNAILGRVTMHNLQVVTLTYHQCMKFPIEARICTIKG